MVSKEADGEEELHFQPASFEVRVVGRVLGGKEGEMDFFEEV